MILEFILNAIKSAMILSLNLTPSFITAFELPDLSALQNGVATLFFLVGKPLLTLCLFTVMSLYAFQIGASIFKFIYRKIPGIS